MVTEVIINGAGNFFVGKRIWHVDIEKDTPEYSICIYERIGEGEFKEIRRAKRTEICKEPMETYNDFSAEVLHQIGLVMDFKVDTTIISKVWGRLLWEKAKYYTDPEERIFNAPFLSTLTERIDEIGKLTATPIREDLAYDLSISLCKELQIVENEMDSSEAFKYILSDEFVPHYATGDNMINVVRTALMQVC